MLNALGQIASKFRARVGESIMTLEKHDMLLAEVTTLLLEALKAFSAGQKILSTSGYAAAIPLFKKAIEIDPKFAMAYAWLGRMYGDIGESTLSAENTSKAYELRDRANDKEKLIISASYDMQVTGNLEKARQTCEWWVQAYPRAVEPHGFLAGIIYPALGDYDKSIEEAQTSVRLNPDFPIGYAILASSYMALDRLSEAENTHRQALNRKLEIPDFFYQRYALEFLKGDKAGMEREVTQAREKLGVEDPLARFESLALAYSGHLEEATRILRRDVDVARQAGRQEMASEFETDGAIREALFGNAAIAREEAIAALKLSKSRDVQYGVALALAFSGDSFRSQTLTDDLSRRFPEDTTVRFTAVPTLRAVLALKHNQSAKSIEWLQTALPYELGAAASLYPAFIRGEAYLAEGQSKKAAAEFQKILDHRGIVISDPIGAVAHLQIGRAYVMQGDTAKAKAAYQDFLTLWKDADPDIPIYKQAKTEYAKLE